MLPHARAGLRRRPRSPSLAPSATSRSSPTATADGRKPAACPSRPGTRPARTPSRIGCETPRRLGIQELSVYAFSTENWSPPTNQVHGLISMLAQRIANETPALHQAGVRVRFIGRRDRAPEPLATQMRETEALTEGNGSITLFVAFDYGGRHEILQAAQRFQGDTEEQFRSYLYAPEMHDPDLIIRTGGEQRLSNYLLLASRLLRAHLPQRAMARLHARRAPRIPRAVQRTTATLRRALNTPTDSPAQCILAH